MLKIHPFRLLPQQDLKKEIKNFCIQNKVQAGVIVSGVGSLTQAELRLADGKESVRFQGPFKVVSLTGTCSEKGLHLHISLADDRGQVIGGHLLDGCLIHTTAEIVILESEDHIFDRKPDTKTGYLELVIESIS
jgi:predicted DNA-binding protein with PD1-like motif